jgi:hypothetical protein
VVLSDLILVNVKAALSFVPKRINDVRVIAESGQTGLPRHCLFGLGTVRVNADHLDAFFAVGVNVEMLYDKDGNR